MLKSAPERITFELPKNLKKAFIAKVKDNDQDISKVCRAFVRDYLNGDSQASASGEPCS